ncbi:hypothetical protein KCU65_g862, partial [Aureobasidium melanogenum]
MTTVQRFDEHSSPVKFNEAIFGQSTQTALSPLKMHAVHVEERPIPEVVDSSLPPTPSPKINVTLIAQSSSDELESLHTTPAENATEEKVSEDQLQQKPPPIPPKSPLRGAKKTNWLSRLLSKTVGRLSCFYRDHRKKARSKRYKQHKARVGSTAYRSSSVGSGPPVITIPDLGGIADFGDIFADYFADSAGYSGGSAECGGDNTGDCGGNCD